MRSAKNLGLIVLFLMMMVTVGCGKETGRGTYGNQSDVEAVLDERLTEELSETASEEKPEVTTEITIEYTTELSLATGPDASYIGHMELSEEDMQPTGEPDPNADVDLTVMSSNMVYAEVYNMMLNPDLYLGKTIKMKGLYFPLYYDNTGNWYHYVMIKDALACCQNGIEFIWGDGSHSYPDEYPKEDQEIIVMGIFDCYEEEDYIYYYIKTDGYTICD